eukprot:TRINITY_DN41865_c0_g1_i1.p1 TRINITY_DN41865_c0_g1~~TRINITY_DN41865_c0_g1_i1.p1  ORF type:complete len:404 (+),score=68.10 TRINITY_DN41865_c0_g1_i1:76-1287(+)
MASTTLANSGLVAAEAVSKSSFIGKTSSFKASVPSKFVSAKRNAVRSQLDAETKRAAVAGAVTAATALSAGSARAVEAETIVNALDQVEAFSKQAVDAATQAFDIVSSVTGQVVDAATPFVQKAAPVVIDVTKKAVDAATPYANDLAGQTSKALSDSGVEVAPILSAAKTAVGIAGDVTEKTITVASPYAQTTFETLIAQDPAVLAAGAGGLLLLYLLAPSFGGSIAYAARGYAGEFTAAQALDLLSTEDYTLIDVRTDSQKSRSGTPSLPRNAKSKLVTVAVEEVEGKLRGQIRNSRKVEADITAIKIAALKRLGKGSRIILIDSNGDIAKLVAQSLVSLGFKNTWIVKDGVDGGKGWVQSKLATESAGLSFAEVLSPSRIIAGTGTQRVPKNQRLLSSGSD